ncbi:alpha/beta hydrolase family protein [Dyella choica]|nr:prolyl oligopeptidase family serine peptidase [Dyella choica]
MGYKKTWRPFVWLGLFLVVCSASADEASDVDSAPAAMVRHERILHVASDPGDPVTLLMSVYTPDGPGPFPLAVMNHGATSSLPPALQPRYHLSFSVYYFLSRGYAVALPMMRGYAGSGGRLHAHGCDDVATGLEAAKDIRAAISYLKQQPYIDGSRIVVAGQSFGGWNTLALGSLDEPGVKGLVSFAGGMKASSCGEWSDALVRAAGKLGGETKTPSIWFFGDNDAVFPTATWHAMYDSYAAKGGPAELVAYGTFGKDSHNLLGSGEGLHLWMPKLDAFLAKVGLPSTLVDPDYLPQAPPPPSHYAALDDVRAIPYLNAHGDNSGSTYYGKFLQRPLPRAIAIGRTGAGTADGGFDPIARAMKQCQQKSAECRLYAVDNDVVWVRPTPAPPATHFATLDDVNAVPYLDAKGRAGYEKFLAMPRPRVFAIAADGWWDAAALGPDPIAYIRAKCSAAHQDCRLYAVDGDVVWQH